MSDPIAFRACLKTTGQNVRLESEGGGTLSLEFPESELDQIVALRKAFTGVDLYIVATEVRA